MIALRGKLERRTITTAASSSAAPAADTTDGTHNSSTATTTQAETATTRTVWTWKGHWMFGPEVPDPLPSTVGGSTSSNCLPFEYTFDRMVPPDQVLLPSEKPSNSRSREKNSSGTVVAEEEKPQKEESKKTEKEKPNKDSVKKEESLQQETKTDVETKKQETIEKEKESSVDKSNEIQVQTTAAATLEETTKPAATSDNPTTTTTKSVSIQTPKPVPKTFATKQSPSDPDFTDACLRFPEQCPPSGAWKGSFDTLSTTSNKHNHKNPPVPVPETFFLFFNATPPSNAKVCFPQDTSDTPASANHPSNTAIATQPLEILLPGRMHVRGVGENQYGRFEILGSFHPPTSVLQIQRLYILHPETNQEKKPNLRTRRSSANRPTRKRQLSWKRRAASESPTEASTHPAPKQLQQRRRSLSLSSSAASAKKRPRSESEGGGGGRALDLNASQVAATAEPTGAMESHKRAVPVVRSSTAASTATTLTTSLLKLPAAGDPYKARWRAAHFLYYQRSSTDTVSSNTNANSSAVAAAASAIATSNATATANAVAPKSAAGSNAAPTASFPKETASTHATTTIAAPTSTTTTTKSQAAAPKYVVYEGELLHSKRHGRGICLYSNGMLYQGGWRHDKEHGYGILMTSDRQHVLYKGDFEKGRIHGQGIYYYNNNNGSSATGKTSNKAVKIKDENTANKDTTTLMIQSRYEGEFKENLRHGQGTYYMPDGAVYSGSFVQNFFSGRGVFTWPDGSLYNGEWKDGRRHGLGVLRVVDGFSYDGSWVDNCMEGRGSATYPNGQQYNGMFSNGRREGRGTMLFTNGAVYEGRFRNDAIDGQGTMKMGRTLRVPKSSSSDSKKMEGISETDKEEEGAGKGDGTESNNDSVAEQEDDDDYDDGKEDFMIPLSFQSDIGHIHRRAGFTHSGS